MKNYHDKTILADCLSKVTVTEQFTDEYMEVFKKYNTINAQLFQIVDGKKTKITKEKTEKRNLIKTFGIDLSTKLKKRRVVADMPVNKMPDIIFDMVKLKRGEKVDGYFIINNHKTCFNN